MIVVNAIGDLVGGIARGFGLVFEDRNHFVSGSYVPGMGKKAPR